MHAKSFLLPVEWHLPAGVRAACTMRTGGVSDAPFDSFNTAAHVGDVPEAVAANRAALRAALDLAAEPAWLEQVHGTAVIDIDHLPANAAPPVADAAIASRALRACVVQVADCLPVLFASHDGQRVGAAHAGWRGLAAGVLEATVRALAVDPAALHVWLGPAIGPAHFEVGEEVREEFVSRADMAELAFTRNARGRWQCNLVLLARQRLAALGVHAITGGSWCTAADRERFFSFRRDGRCGRMAALIWRT